MKKIFNFVLPKLAKFLIVFANCFFSRMNFENIENDMKVEKSDVATQKSDSADI